MNVIEIRDPTINAEEILELVAERMKDQTSPDFSAIGPETLRFTETIHSSSVNSQADNPELFLDLIMTHQLEEPKFSSETPIIGSWIVRLRELWNWMSTKWYVRPIMRQQSTINGQMVLILIEMDALLKEYRQSISQLEEKVNQLESLITSHTLQK
ncbi:MAG: hypothetical protein IPM53_27965 [Anaerolineaceae bacterium]|nr:hypothetical protein [Anaerolineaceae bacterium]